MRSTMRAGFADLRRHQAGIRFYAQAGPAISSRDIARGHAWHGPYRRPSTERVRNWLMAFALAMLLASLAGAGF